MLHDETATCSLGRVLGVGQCGVDDLYRALDWLHEAQPAIERRLARQHLLAPGKEFHIYRHPMGRWYGRLPSPPKAERVVSEGS